MLKVNKVRRSSQTVTRMWLKQLGVTRLPKFALCTNFKLSFIRIFLLRWSTSSIKDKSQSVLDFSWLSEMSGSIESQNLSPSTNYRFRSAGSDTGSICASGSICSNVVAGEEEIHADEIRSTLRLDEDNDVRECECTLDLFSEKCVVCQCTKLQRWCPFQHANTIKLFPKVLYQFIYLTQTPA